MILKGLANVVKNLEKVKEPVAKAIIVGIAYGIIYFGIIAIANRYNMYYFVYYAYYSFIFYINVIIIGILAYSIFKTIKSGIIFGVFAKISEFLLIFVFLLSYSYNTFYYFQTFNTFDYFQTFIPTLLFNVLAGFLGGYVGGYNQRKSELKITSSSFTDVENQVFGYINAHNYKINISNCAKKLNITEDEVTSTLKSLEAKGILKKKQIYM